MLFIHPANCERIKQIENSAHHKRNTIIYSSFFMGNLTPGKKEEKFIAYLNKSVGRKENKNAEARYSCMHKHKNNNSLIMSKTVNISHLPSETKISLHKLTKRSQNQEIWSRNPHWVVGRFDDLFRRLRLNPKKIKSSDQVPKQ